MMVGGHPAPVDHVLIRSGKAEEQAIDFPSQDVCLLACEVRCGFLGKVMSGWWAGSGGRALACSGRGVWPQVCHSSRSDDIVASTLMWVKVCDTDTSINIISNLDGMLRTLKLCTPSVQ